MLSQAFLSLLVLATTLLPVSAKPIPKNSPITLPVARRVNATGTAHILKMDQARAKHLKDRAKSRQKKISATDSVFGVPSDNQAVNYAVNIGIGEPMTVFTLLVDTGSSNTWVGANELNPFVVSDTSIDTGNLVEVVYGSGFFVGEEFIDTFTFGSGFTITNQSIGAAFIADGFFGVDGILGIGPQDLTCGTMFPDSSCVPTVTDNAFAQGLIDSNMVGISFQPTQSLEVTNGEIAFGGIDGSKFNGDLHWIQLTGTFPASEFVGIDQTITYGAARTPILPTSAGITDTGTTLLLLATDAFNAYVAATGAVFDPNVGLLSITPDQFANLESLFFDIGGKTFEFTPNAQIWPRALNTAIGGVDGTVYLILGDIGTTSGQGLDFVNGMTFLERFYTVFDGADSFFAIGETEFTRAETN